MLDQLHGMERARTGARRCCTSSATPPPRRSPTSRPRWPRWRPEHGRLGDEGALSGAAATAGLAVARPGADGTGATGHGAAQGISPRTPGGAARLAGGLAGRRGRGPGRRAGCCAVVHASRLGGPRPRRGLQLPPCSGELLWSGHTHRHPAARPASRAPHPRGRAGHRHRRPRPRARPPHADGILPARAAAPRGAHRRHPGRPAPGRARRGDGPRAGPPARAARPGPRVLHGAAPRGAERGCGPARRCARCACSSRCWPTGRPDARSAPCRSPARSSPSPSGSHPDTALGATEDAGDHGGPDAAAHRARGPGLVAGDDAGLRGRPCSQPLWPCSPSRWVEWSHGRTDAPTASPSSAPATSAAPRWVSSCCASGSRRPGSATGWSSTRRAPTRGRSATRPTRARSRCWPATATTTSGAATTWPASSSGPGCPRSTSSWPPTPATCAS